MTRSIAIIALFLGQLGAGVLAHAKDPTAGAIRGVVVTIDFRSRRDFRHT